jgi:hypothetical protein
MVQSQLDKVIDDFNHLSLDEKEYISEILHKQLIEAKREAIAKRADEAINNYKTGNIKSGTIEELKKDLEND